MPQPFSHILSRVLARRGDKFWEVRANNLTYKGISTKRVLLKETIYVQKNDVGR